MSIKCFVRSFFVMHKVYQCTCYTAIVTIRTRYTVHQTWMMVAGVWTLSVIYSCRALIPTHDSNPVSRCSSLSEDPDYDLFVRCADLFVYILIPLVTMTVLYGRIIQRLWVHSTINNDNHSQRQGLKQKRRAVKTFALCCILFFCCFMPFNLIDIAKNYQIKYNFPSYYMKLNTWINMNFATVLLIMFNSFVNPFIYAIFNKKIR